MSETCMMLLILLDLALLSISRLNTAITLAGFQGFLLGLFVISSHAHSLSVRMILIAGAGMIVKGFVFPLLMRRAVKEAGIQREMKPFINASLSVVLGVVMLGCSLWLGNKLTLSGINSVPYAVPASFLTMFTGLFLIIARSKALTQCIGYIVFENGIYAFGVAAAGEIPMLVELGLLLDAFVAVFVMGIAIYHIKQEFNHIDATELSSLKG